MVAKCHPICLLVFIVISKSIPERNCSLSKWRFYCIRWRANHAHRCQKLLSAQDTYQLFDKFLGNGWINIQARISQKLKLKKKKFYLKTSYIYLFITLGSELHFKRRPKYPLKGEISTQNAKCKAVCCCCMVKPWRRQSIIRLAWIICLVVILANY